MVSQVMLVRWKCRNGHVLGWVERNGGGAHVLMLLREAVLTADPGRTPCVPTGEGGGDQAEVDVAALVEGKAEVRCSVCGDVRSWWPDANKGRRMKSEG